MTPGLACRVLTSDAVQSLATLFKHLGLGCYRAAAWLYALAARIERA